jgi:hypothetical protein
MVDMIVSPIWTYDIKYYSSVLTDNSTEDCLKQLFMFGVFSLCSDILFFVLSLFSDIFDLFVMR